MESLRSGDVVIHNGEEKTIAEIHGDVIILSDKSCVRENEISLVENADVRLSEVPENAELADMQASEKAALRSRLESISATTLMADTIGIIREVDPNMSITAANLEDVDALKQVLIRTALRLRKIDPKVCLECGQTIPE